MSDSLPDSFKYRSLQYSTIKHLLSYHDTIPYPKQLYIFGNSNTGKSSIVKHVLESVVTKSNIIYIDCREIFSLNMFFNSFFSSFINDVDDKKKFYPKNLNEFIRKIRDYCFKQKKKQQHYFVVLHHIELLLQYDTSSTLLYILFKLEELTLDYFKYTLIMISNKSFNNLITEHTIEADLGSLLPITIFFSAYTRTELNGILQQTITTFLDLSSDQLQLLKQKISIILTLELQLFYDVTNDLIELKDICLMCIKDFLRLNERSIGDNDDGDDDIDYRLFYQKEFLTKALNSVYTRTMSVRKFLDTHDIQQVKINNDNNYYSTLNQQDVELPLTCKYLLIACYLAARNPSKYDKQLYDKRQITKRSKRSKIAQKRITGMIKSTNEIFISKPVLLNRLLAIYCSIVGENNPLTCQTYQHLTTLCSMGMLKLVGNKTGNINLNESKFLCLISYDYIKQIASSIQFQIDHLLL
ncbi:unnamed protein product [Didymodactylos carnosus]|uniref:Origin recognition complex subunit 5 C-terminal domain-containing protein n=1 Tax=Didymodactylos carnosus TaxID=1234261 RepID=A0A813R946_9BILA|nr:unnamed protein product [Didymodactylos carnosus]CAF3561512.1 unnamed protein product [Didymodactylos carnosus]